MKTALLVASFLVLGTVHSLRVHRQATELPSEKREISHAKFSIVQFGDEYYLEKFQNWTVLVDKYAELQGYPVERMNLADEAYVQEHYPMLHQGQVGNKLSSKTKARTARYMAKPLVIRQKLDAVKTPWVVFMDLDTAPAKASMRFEDILEKAGIDAKGCSLVAQDGDKSVNTGFLMVKNDENGRAALNEWIVELNRIGGVWYGDQGPFMSVILHHANTTGYHNQCDPQKGGDGRWPADTLGGMAKVFKSDHCYTSILHNQTEYVYGGDVKNLNNICVLDYRKHRINIHNAKGEPDHYRPGDFLYHGKETAFPKAILEKWPGVVTWEDLPKNAQSNKGGAKGFGKSVIKVVGNVGEASADLGLKV